MDSHFEGYGGRPQAVSSPVPVHNIISESERSEQESCLHAPAISYRRACRYGLIPAVGHRHGSIVSRQLVIASPFVWPPLAVGLSMFRRSLRNGLSLEWPASSGALVPEIAQFHDSSRPPVYDGKGPCRIADRSESRVLAEKECVVELRDLPCEIERCLVTAGLARRPVEVTEYVVLEQELGIFLAEFGLAPD